MVTDIDADAAAAWAGELDGAISFRLDVTDEEQTASMAAATVDAWGGIDIVAANAGLPHPNAAVIAGIPMGRRAVPRDVAASVLFRASDDAELLTGVALDVDGGRSIG